MPLQDLDLVAIGVLNKKEPRHQLAVAEELLDFSGLQAEALRPVALGAAILHTYGKMAESIAVGIRRRTLLVERQLDFEVNLRIT